MSHILKVTEENCTACYYEVSSAYLNLLEQIDYNRYNIDFNHGIKKPIVGPEYDEVSQKLAIEISRDSEEAKFAYRFRGGSYQDNWKEVAKQIRVVRTHPKEQEYAFDFLLNLYH